MNNFSIYLILALLLLSGCSSIRDERPQPIRQGEYYLQQGVSAYEESDYVTAIDFFSKSLAYYRSIDHIDGVLLSHINLIEAALSSGNFKEAEKNITAAEGLVKQNSTTQFLPRLKLLRAQVHWRRKETDQALQLLEQLLPEFDSEQRSKVTPDPHLLSTATLRTAIAFSEKSELHDAKIWLRRLSLMLSRTSGRTELHQARLLRFEAQLAFSEGEPQQALSKLDKALHIYRQGAVRPAIAATLTDTGKLFMKMEEWEKAEETLQRALYIRLWIMDRHGTAELMELLQQVYQSLGDEEGYRQMKEEAQRIGAVK